SRLSGVLQKSRKGRKVWLHRRSLRLHLSDGPQWRISWLLSARHVRRATGREYPATSRREPLIFADALISQQAGQFGVRPVRQFPKPARPMRGAWRGVRLTVVRWYSR